MPEHKTGSWTVTTNDRGDVIDVRSAAHTRGGEEAIERDVPDARATVTGGGGHFTIDVVSPVFAGKSMLESQRLVYRAIAHLMKGDLAPVHAVDSLTTRTPG